MLSLGCDLPAATMEHLVQEFIARENIRNFQAQLEGCTDEEQKAILLKLLHDEERHLEAMLDKQMTGAECSNVAGNS